MSFTQFSFVEKLVQLRAEEDRRWVEKRRLQREAQASRTPALHRNRLWLLSRVGGLVITLGKRFHRGALKQAGLKMAEAKKGGRQ